MPSASLLSIPISQKCVMVYLSFFVLWFPLHDLQPDPSTLTGHLDHHPIEIFAPLEVPQLPDPLRGRRLASRENGAPGMTAKFLPHTQEAILGCRGRLGQLSN